MALRTGLPDGMRSGARKPKDVTDETQVQGDTRVSESRGDGIEFEFGFVPRFELPAKGTTHETLLSAAAQIGSLTLDVSALNVFLRTGYFLAGSTPFKEIRRLGPPPVTVPPAAYTREEARDIYIQLFREAIRRRGQQATALALSGGADSRHILLELHAQGLLPAYALTVAVPGRRREVEIAAEVARRVGAKHVVVTPDPHRAVQDELWKNPACDFLALEHGWFAGTAQSRDDLPWWDGVAGDVLSAGHFIEEWNVELFEQGRLDELAERLVPLREVPYFVDRRGFARDEAVAAVRNELDHHRDAANPVGSYFLWNRTRSAVGASVFRLLRPTGQTTLAPFLDRALWHFLSSLPARMTVDHNFHRETIAFSYPEFRDIPYFASSMKMKRQGEGIVARALLLYLLSEGGASISNLRAALRALRAVLFPSHRYGLRGLLHTSVYCTQIQRLTKDLVHASHEAER